MIYEIRLSPLISSITRMHHSSDEGQQLTTVSRYSVSTPSSDRKEKGGKAERQTERGGRENKQNGERGGRKEIDRKKEYENDIDKKS